MILEQTLLLIKVKQKTNQIMKENLHLHLQIHHHHQNRKRKMGSQRKHKSINQTLRKLRPLKQKEIKIEKQKILRRNRKRIKEINKKIKRIKRTQKIMKRKVKMLKETNKNKLVRKSKSKRKNGKKKNQNQIIIQMKNSTSLICVVNYIKLKVICSRLMSNSLQIQSSYLCSISSWMIIEWIKKTTIRTYLLITLFMITG